MIKCRIVEWSVEGWTEVCEQSCYSTLLQTSHFAHLNRTLIEVNTRILLLILLQQHLGRKFKASVHLVFGFSIAHIRCDLYASYSIIKATESEVLNIYFETTTTTMMFLNRYGLESKSNSIQLSLEILITSMISSNRHQIFHFGGCSISEEFKHEVNHKLLMQIIEFRVHLFPIIAIQ